jgi:ABC-type transport system substrate-binding protein
MEDSVTLIRNPHYHGTFGGNVNRVEAGLLRKEVGWQEGMERYMRGDLDFLDVSWFPGDVIGAAQRRFGEYYTILLPYPTTVGLYFDGQQEPVHDPRVRRALAMAIDQEQLVRDLQKDAVIPALGGFVPPGVPGHAPDIGLPHDPDAARGLLAEAGFADGTHFPLLEMTWIDFPNSREYAGYLSRAWLEELGITIRPVYVPLSELVDMLLQDKRPVIYSIGWTADYRDPDNFLRIGLQDSIRGHRPILSKLRTAGNVREQNRRVALYQEIDRIVVEEGITIPLFYGSYPVLFGPRVRKLPSDFQWRNFILDPDEPEAS